MDDISQIALRVTLCLKQRLMTQNRAFWLDIGFSSGMWANQSESQTTGSSAVRGPELKIDSGVARSVFTPS